MITEDQLTQKKEEIKTDIATHNVMLYMKGNKEMPMCGFSNQVVHILNQSGVTYEAKNVLDDEILRQAIKEFSDWPTIPQLYVNGEFIGGCDIITELFQSGDLHDTLAECGQNP
jgi:monothiol glutaredoxin